MKNFLNSDIGLREFARGENILQSESDGTGEDTSSSKRVSDNGATSVQRSSGSRSGRSSRSTGNGSTGNTAGGRSRGASSGSAGTGGGLGQGSSGGVLGRSTGGGGRSESSSGGSRGAVGATSHVELLGLSQDTGVFSRVGEQVDLVAVTIFEVSYDFSSSMGEGSGIPGRDINALNSVGTLGSIDSSSNLLVDTGVDGVVDEVKVEA